MHWNVYKDSVKADLSSIEKKLAGDYFPSEMAAMKKTAENLIKNWYRDSIPSASCFSGKINSNDNIENIKLSISGSDIKADEIKVTINKYGKEVTITDLPNVRIYVDPQNHMDTAKEYPQDAKAYYDFTNPSFTIKFNEDFTDGSIEGKFANNELIEPKSIEVVQQEEAEARAKLEKIIPDFKEKLNIYLNEPNTKNANDLKAMFKKDAKVFISIAPKSGKAGNPREYSIDRYLSRIKGTQIEIENFEEAKFADNDFSTATINFNQKYVRSSYCDHTDKKMILQKDNDGEYKISRIEVVNAAVRCGN